MYLRFSLRRSSNSLSSSSSFSKLTNILLVLLFGSSPFFICFSGLFALCGIGWISSKESEMKLKWLNKGKILIIIYFYCFDFGVLIWLLCLIDCKPINKGLDSKKVFFILDFIFNIIFR